MRATVFGAVVMEMNARAAAPPQPGRVVHATQLRSAPGGRSGAQAAYLSRMGCKTRLVGALGADPTGELLRLYLESRGVDISAIKVIPRAETGAHMRYALPTGELASVECMGANAVLSADLIPDAALQQSDLFVSQLSVPAAELISAAIRARSSGCMVVVDASGFVPTRLFASGHFDWLSADAPEFARLCAAWGIFGVDPMDCCRLLAERLGCGVACDLGPEGAIACVPGGQVVAVPGNPSSRNSQQCSAVFCAAFALAMCSSAGAQTALLLAQQAAVGRHATVDALRARELVIA